MHRRRYSNPISMFNILLIEDSEDDAYLLEQALRRENIRSSMCRVSNGREAILYLEGRENYADRKTCPFPDIIFTDLKMPGMDGFEFLLWLRSHPRCSILPAMVFSSSALETDIEKSYRLGANAYLTKPGTLVALQDSVRKAHDFWIHCKRPRIKLE